LAAAAPQPSSEINPWVSVFLDLSFASYQDVITSNLFNGYYVIYGSGCAGEGDLENPVAGLGLTGPPPGEAFIRRSMGCQEANLE
jgi:hypothetical protein